MTTPPASIALFALAALLGAVGQFLYKSGAEAATGGLSSYLLNWRLGLGVFCYVAVMVLFVRAFRLGGSLTVLYPVYASTFIWAAVLSAAAYGVPIRPVNVLGMGLLVAGMYCLGRT